MCYAKYFTVPEYLSYMLTPSHSMGESRAYWSLGNAYTAMRDHRQARHYASKHLTLSLELGDTEGAATAQRNVEDLDTVLNLSDRYGSDYKQFVGRDSLLIT